MEDIDKFKKDFVKDTEDFEKVGFIFVSIVMLVLMGIVVLCQVK